MEKGKLVGSSSSKANKPKKGPNYKKTPWHKCQCSGSSQIPIQDDLNYHQFLSLYHIRNEDGRTKLIIYDTENENEEVTILDTKSTLDYYTTITQLPNGELFFYGSGDTGTTGIIDRSYRIRLLPSGIGCQYSAALYFNNNIYFFGGFNIDNNEVALSRKFDLKNNRWINLTRLPENDHLCHSVIFNGNILISGYEHKNLWLYSIEIDSFSTIPYDFAENKRKFLINVERLFLIEWCYSSSYENYPSKSFKFEIEEGWIYESEDEYHWKPISKSGQFYNRYHQMYCLYNKEKIYISGGMGYYQFDLKAKVMRQINN